MADTHLRGELHLPRPLHRAVERADIVLHAGDITSGLALRQLCGLADVWAVVGNNDHELVGALPVTLSILLDQVRVAVVHDSGPTRGAPGACPAAFRRPTWSSSGTVTCPSTNAGSRASCCSTPAHRPSGASNRRAPSDA